MRPRRVIQAPGEKKVYDKIKEYGLSVVFIEQGRARSSQYNTERAQRILIERANDVVGTYDQRVCMPDLREDIHHTMREGAA